ncbi:MAG TPA: anti-sigma factor [Jiangellales bacterium]|nr:anti-sigma factor [Jiangellales bacterium]
MQHCDPDVLALRALGEDAGPPGTEDHLASCDRCRGELDGLQSVVRAARSAGPDDLPQHPPARVWDGISRELGLGATAAPAPAPVPDAPTTLPPVPDELATARDRRRTRLAGRTAPLLVAAAVGGVVAGGVGVWALTGLGGDEPAVEIVAETRLDPLPSWDAEGTAAVEITAEGTRYLVVDVAGAGSGDHDGYHEVWLLDPEVSQLVSLGVLDGDRGTFAIPAGLDLGELPVVDVSLEPYDGNPAHSGDSVVRGTLDS